MSAFCADQSVEHPVEEQLKDRKAGDITFEDLLKVRQSGLPTVQPTRPAHVLLVVSSCRQSRVRILPNGVSKSNVVWSWGCCIGSLACRACYDYPHGTRFFLVPLQRLSIRDLSPHYLNKLTTAFQVSGLFKQNYEQPHTSKHRIKESPFLFARARLMACTILVSSATRLTTRHLRRRKLRSACECPHDVSPDD